MRKTLITSQEKVTDGQVAKIKELTEAALRQSSLDGGGVQRVIEKGGELQKKIIPVFQELGELPFADEEVESSYGYPEGWQLKSVPEQLAILQEIKQFKRLDAGHVEEVAKRFSEFPEGAESLGVIPKPTKVSKSYNEATILMANLMKARREDWHNYREGRLGPEYLRLTEKTQQVLSRLEKETPGDFLVIPTQVGLRHRGRSVRRARVMMSVNEWGLGPYEVGIILLTHQERLQRNEDLAIDCAGCEYCPRAGGDFSGCLYFDGSGGELEFDCSWADDADQDFGSASAFG